MNLLPKSTSQFSQSEYWNAFFKQRGKKAFEWYGEYAELCGFLHKYIKPKEKLLVIGCGNSKLSADLFDVGYRDITNIDISEVVIKQMKALHAEERPNLIFLEMDVLNMSFGSESFSVVFDKGTLDALMPKADEKSRETILKLFEEVDRVLKVGGRYICVSLLQVHILNIILEQFVEKGWMVRVCRCHEVEEKAIEEGIHKSLPVFVVICTKFKKLPNSKPVLELSLLSNGSITRVDTVEEVKRGVLEDQQMAMICNGLQMSTLAGKEIHLDISEPGKDSPKYFLTIVEKPTAKINNLKYAAFIIPQGREAEWLFGTPDGRQELIKGTEYDRLAVIALGRGYTFTSLERVQKDLTSVVLDMAPSTYKPPIQFLSIGGDLGTRKEIARGRSEISGEYLIEECMSSHQTLFRRLYFMSNKDAIQSEARMKKVKSRKGAKMVVDLGYLSSDYHAWMVVGALTLGRGAEAAVIGLGGGTLCTYLRKAIPLLKLTAIDLDPTMVDIATKHFGLIVDENLVIHIGDGVKWLKDTADKDVLYDAIMFDVDSKDKTVGMTFPPANFVEVDILKSVHKIISEDGIFIINLVSRDASLRNEVWNRLKSVFCTVASIKLEEDLNEIVFSWKKKDLKPSDILGEATGKLVRIIKEKNMEKLDCVNPKNFLKLLKMK